MASDASVVTPGEFRAVMGRFVTGVTVMTTVADGVPHAMTVNAFTSVSLKPPLVLVCVDHGVRMHDAVLDTGVWAVSVLGADGEAVARRFARSGRALREQFDGVPVTAAPGTGCPVVAGALAWLECRTWATYPGGDHTIVVGEVIGLGDGPVGDGGALAYYAGRYRTLPGV